MTIPGTTETVLGRSFKSAESIKNYISGLKTMHLMLGVKFPEESCIRLIWCLGDWCALKTHAQPRTSYDSTDFEGYTHFRICLDLAILHFGDCSYLCFPIYVLSNR